MVPVRMGDDRIPEVPAHLEDPLSYLRCSTIVEYQRGQIIYGPQRPPKRLFLIVDGAVKVSRIRASGGEAILDIYLPEEFIGESAFVGPETAEQATALEKTRLMTWTAADVEDSILRQPRLGLALVQMMVRRSQTFAQRIETFTTDGIARRLVGSLLRFAERLGTPEEDGSVRIMPLTHAVLAQYVGTSREIVTHHMNDLQRAGCVRYSRKGIILYRNECLETYLQTKPTGDAVERRVVAMRDRLCG